MLLQTAGSGIERAVCETAGYSDAFTGSSKWNDFMTDTSWITANQKNIRYISEAYLRGKLSHAYIVEGDEDAGTLAFADYIAASLLCEQTAQLHRTGQMQQASQPEPLPRSEQIGQIMQLHRTGQMQQASQPELLPRSEQMGQIMQLHRTGLLANPEQIRGVGPGLLKPCGRCPACIRALSGNHPDIIHVTHEKDTVLAVSEIREQVVGDTAIKPYYGPYKIYIIPQAQLMNENAQNALLKTIEEPQEYVLVLLLTDNAEWFLPTIKSRCIRIRMADRSREETVRKLMDEDGTRALQIIREVSSMTAADIGKVSKELETMDRAKILQIFLFWLRDLLMFKTTGDSGRLYYQAFLNDIRYISGTVNYEAINQALEAWDILGSRLKANVKPDAAYEAFLLKVRQCYSGRIL